ncbi:MAG: DUF167 family protein [Bauldia sp.]|nr:DUF167 family protein [Bauldia sp.]
MSCYRVEAGGIVLSVRLTPKASREGVDGIGRLSDGRAVVLARVRGLPEDGAANAALTALLAKTFHVPKSAVSIVAGGKARLKQVRIAGTPSDLVGVVAAWPASGASS